MPLYQGKIFKMCTSVKSCQVSLDKLRQGGTNNDNAFNGSLTRQGFNRPAMVKRARRKFLSQNLAYQLVAASRDDVFDSMESQYWTTVRCGDTVHFDGIETKSKYCNKRWCTVCNSIRTAQMIDKYQPVLEQWNDKHFVTLTIKSVTAKKLKFQIEEMLADLRRIRDTAKKRHQRGKLENKPMAICKLECNYNPSSNTFNPHFHIVTSTLEFAELLRNEWQERHPADIVNSQAQDIRKAGADSVSEMFKYFTKLISNTNGKREIYADAMNVIFRAVKGRRVFFHYGFKQNKKQDIDTDPVDTEETPSVDVDAMGDQVTDNDGPMPGTYKWNQNDWVGVSAGIEGRRLTGYEPSDKFKNFIKSGIKFIDNRQTYIPKEPERKRIKYKIY